MPVGDKDSGAEHCHGARAAVHPYRLITWELQDRRHGRHADRTPIVRGKSCRHARLAMREWRGRAAAARDSWRKWLRDEWSWEAWLPSDWRARSRCELGYDLQLRSWRSNVFTSNGNFQGFVNFYDGTWDSYRLPGYPSEAYLASPRQQFTVALAVARSAGLGAWNSCATP